VVTLTFIFVGALLPVSAGAVDDSEELTRFGSEGTGAGQLRQPKGVATNFDTGHVYVVDAGNYRIDEFGPWGGFVKAWGWGVADGNAELQTCTTTCLAGLPGSGPGQLGGRFGSDGPAGIAVDSNGDIYVSENSGCTGGACGQKNFRIQKFASSGDFLLMFGGGVDEGPVHPGSLCTAAFIAEGDECGAGHPGTGDGEFAAKPGGNYVAVGPDDIIYVGDKDRVEEFQPNGSYKTSLPLPKPGVVTALAVDSLSHIYLSYAQPVGGVSASGVFELNASGLLIDTLQVDRPAAIAVDLESNVYVVAEPVESEPDAPIERVLQFDATGDRIGECCSPELLPAQNTNEPRYKLTGVGTNSIGDLYVVSAKALGDGAYVKLFGPAPVTFEPPPPSAPTIGASYASSVNTDSATVQAEINPNFWADTSYYVEFGTAPCSSNPCTSKPPNPAPLGAGPVKKLVTSAGVLLAGLQANTTYYYRFVAESGGGGPVVGGDRSFTTEAEPPPLSNPDPCPNAVFRNGPGGRLPDCRAYEMVSPPNKNGGDILALPNATGFSSALDLSSTNGDKATYSSYRAFGDSQSAPYTSQYIASRDSGGWVSEAISPPRGPSFYDEAALNGEYKTFSADLAGGWLLHDANPQLSSDAVDDFPNLYRRDNQLGGYEALTTAEPQHREPRAYRPDLQAVSANGQHSVFRVDDQLTPDAPNLGVRQRLLYESFGGELRLVSILPNGAPSMKASSAGTPAVDEYPDFGASVDHAISTDGSRIFWSESEGGPGKLYVRIDGERTVAVSGSVSSKPARFWTATSDGAKVFFTITEGGPGSLYEFNVDSEEATLIAPKAVGVLGASDDGSSIYLVSEAALVSGATPSKPNLYLYRAGEATFIATLSSADVDTSSGHTLSPVSPAPTYRTARVSEDGSHVAFNSNASLTGYDNLDAKSGKADAEVYVYDAGSEELNCLSCLGSGARPVGREYRAPAAQPLLAAATVPLWQNQLTPSRPLSEDGTRLFFTSFVGLLPRDTNGKADVYEWEEPGTGDCRTDASAFRLAAGGCIGLISTGESPSDSEFLDASSNGNDVFFGTNASLVPQDSGLIDIYDARVSGGFASPPGPAAACEGEACLPSPTAPQVSVPSSSTFVGPGNPRAKKHHRKHQKRKHHKNRHHRHHGKKGAR
jgi:hypothetical protein